jgi:hypothetical protein
LLVFQIGINVASVARAPKPTSTPIIQSMLIASAGLM